MQVTTFRLENAEYTEPSNPAFNDGDALFHLPILAAYAVHHSKVEMENALHVDFGYQQPKYVIENDTVRLKNIGSDMFSPHRGLLTLYHAGIKDYSLLFPHINNESLRQRLGQFAQEAESAFESQSWMSYVMMVGAVVEGLLFNQFNQSNKHNFTKLIKLAEESGILNTSDVTVIDEVRKLRNRVHASKHKQAFADRKIAMELNVIYERLLKRQWQNIQLHLADAVVEKPLS
jgi:hypothetical protein